MDELRYAAGGEKLSEKGRKIIGKKLYRSGKTVFQVPLAPANASWSEA